MKIWFSILFTLITTLTHSNSQQHPKYELRGVWVATVKNIDWPSKPGLPVEKQKQEILKWLEITKKYNLNAIFLQVRPCSDAFYKSDLEPWSEYLNGQSGKAPAPFYDPLTFWIDEAHKRGIELHAWINPFRASMAIDDKLSENHPINQHPEWFIEYNNKHQYDAGNPSCRKHITYIVKDLISRYKIDGIHMDDYFYPYPNAGIPFNDSTSFAKYNPLNIDDIHDWRRYNVDKTIASIDSIINKSRPHIAFGISPFGVWRNKEDDANGSETRAGITNYDHLYADILKWMNEGLIDYVVPQLYWSTEHTVANFNTLSKWWSKHSKNTPLVIGHGLYRVNKYDGIWKDSTQILDQIRITRDSTQAIGSAFFSIKHLTRDLSGLQDSLKNGVYKHPSLIPSLIHSIPDPVSAIEIHAKKWFSTIKWKYTHSNNPPTKFIIYRYKADAQNPLLNAENIYEITGLKKIKLDKRHFLKDINYYIKIEAIDQYNRSCGMSFPIRKKY